MDKRSSIKKESKMVEKSATANNQQIQSKLLGANVNEISIEKFRDIKQVNPFQLNGKLTGTILRTMSGKFSLDTIFILDISGQKLTSIEPLSECRNLISLNMSCNSINDLGPLRYMSDLALLNASQNTLNMIEQGYNIIRLPRMEKLSHVLLKGNNLKSMKSIESLQKMDSLRSLYLQSLSQQMRNPLCDLNNYRITLFSQFKQLVRLDGYSRDVKFNDGSEIQAKKPDVKIELKCQDSAWYTSQFPKVDTKVVEQKEEIDIRNTLQQTRKVASNLEMKLQILLSSS